METFDYRPLDEGTYEIRLLELDDNFESRSDDVRARLIYTQFQESNAETTSEQQDVQSGWGDFAALSYVWGVPTLPTRHISLDGHMFQVTINLHLSLTRIRRLMKLDKTFSRRVWIDAICINQNDIEERNRQVPRMRYIYSEARTVVCSLPPEWAVNEEKNEASEKTMNWRPAVRMLRNLAQVHHSNRHERFAQELQTQNLCYDPSRWMALVTFFANPYWGRLWIVQEIALASHQILVLAGGENVLAWDTVASAAQTFGTLPYTVRNDITRAIRGSGGSTVPFSRNVDQIINIQSEVFKRQQKSHLYAEPSRAIRIAGKAEAKNVRDKVYGLLSLVDPQIVERIRVDYAKTPATVWRDFATAVVETTGCLEILPACAQPDHNKARGAPSWVPDLGNGIAVVPFRQVSLQNHGKEVKIKPHINGSVLSVQGLCLRSIDGVTSIRTFDDLFTNANTERGMIQSTSVSSQAGRSNYASPTDLYRRLLNTLLSASRDNDAGGSNGEMPPLDWLREKSRASRDARVPSFFEQNDEFLLPGGHRLKDVLNAPPSLDPSSSEEQKVHIETEKTEKAYEDTTDHISATLTYRRLATTMNGQIALVPCDTRPGDCVYALAGYDGRGILRKNGEHWRWVGSCYVDGLMLEDDIDGREAKMHQLDII